MGSALTVSELTAIDDAIKRPTPRNGHKPGTLSLIDTSDFAEAVQSIDAELEVMDGLLAQPRLEDRALVEDSRATLAAERAILQCVADYPEAVAVFDGLDRERQLIDFELARRTIPFGGRAGLSPAKVRREKRQSFGLSQRKADGATVQLVARRTAIMEMIPVLRDRVFEAPSYVSRPKDDGR